MFALSPHLTEPVQKYDRCAASPPSILEFSSRTELLCSGISSGEHRLTGRTGAAVCSWVWETRPEVQRCVQSSLSREAQQCFGVHCKRGSLLSPTQVHLSYLHKILVDFKECLLDPTWRSEDKVCLRLISTSSLPDTNDSDLYSPGLGSELCDTHFLYHISLCPKTNAC